jgi:hypothetical protein
MKKIIVTESQAKLIGIKINENADSDSGLKTSGSALGPKPIRVVISGDDVPKLKDTIIKLVKRQDPESTVAYYEATGKIVGNISEYKLGSVKRDIIQLNPNILVKRKQITKSLKEGKKNIVKITKEQYQKLLSNNLIKEDQEVKIKGGLKRVDKMFKKHVKLDESYDLMQETKNLIEYLYRKNENLSPFWSEHGLTYEDICEALSSENMILGKEGKWQLSKNLGTPEMAINTVMERLKKMINKDDELKTESDGYLPSGAEFNSNAPWNKENDTTQPIKPKSKEFIVLYYNREMAILKDNKGDLFYFNYDFIPREEFADYAEQSRTYAGKDEEGFPMYDYDDSWEIDGAVLSAYVNDNFNGLSKGMGIDGFDTGKDLVVIDSELKTYLLKLYDKDKKLIDILGGINELYYNDDEETREKTNKTLQKFVDDTEKTRKPIEKTEPKSREEVIRMAKLFAKLYDKPFEEMFEKLKKRYDIDETTTAASSGSYTAPFLSGPSEAPEDPNKLNVPVVGEVTAGSQSVGAYDANALPNIGRDGEFKKKVKTSDAFKKTQYPKGGFVKFNDCVKLNNKPAGAGCSQGAVDGVVKISQTKGNITAPSLNENRDN